MKQSKIVIKCQPNVSEIYSYLLRHTFYGAMGAARLGMSFLFLITAYFTKNQVNHFLILLLVLIGLLNPVITPVWLYFKALQFHQKQSIITYEFDSENVLAKQGNEHFSCKWSSFCKIIWTRKLLVLYVSSQKALLIPRREMNSNEGSIRDILSRLPESCNLKLCKDKFPAAQH